MGGIRKLGARRHTFFPHASAPAILYDMTEQKRRKAGERSNVSQLRDTILPNDVKPISRNIDRWVNVTAYTTPNEPDPLRLRPHGETHPYTGLMPSRPKYDCSEEFDLRQEEDPLRWDGA